MKAKQFLSIKAIAWLMYRILVPANSERSPLAPWNSEDVENPLCLLPNSLLRNTDSNNNARKSEYSLRGNASSFSIPLLLECDCKRVGEGTTSLFLLRVGIR